ncbi:MAG TPA: MauE/DoxX family redox-associated membrane protein [Thermomonospora sp.]|nr:MauE/DoxX family redox-associated membrane protein [Thermomonospora sp.]
MMDLLADVQVLLLATVLAFAGLAKLVFREPEPRRPAEVHGVPVPAAEPGWAVRLRHSRPVNLALGLTETALAVGLLLTAHLAVRTAVLLLLSAATWVVVELRERTPNVGCGCFGRFSHERVGRRSVVRTALLTAAAVGALGGTRAGYEVAAGASWQAWVLFGAELAVLAALSPEPVALLRRTQRPPVPCERRRSPMVESHTTLWSSPEWTGHRALLTDREPVDVWREGCWRFLAYQGVQDGREVEVVFAVSTHERGRQVRVAVLDAEPRFLSAPIPDDAARPAVPHVLGVAEDDTEDSGPNPRYVMAR